MNPGASWMSSVGTVRSRTAASANTSSTTGTARVKRWAIKVQASGEPPSLWPGWNFQLRLNSAGKKKGGFSMHRCYHSLRVSHASPPACLVFYISLEPAESESEFVFLLRGADPHLFAQWMKATPRLLILWRKKCFYLSQICSRNCCSLSFWPLCAPKPIRQWYIQIAMAYGGRDADCCTQEL